MNTGGDKLVTNAASAVPTTSKPARCGRRKKPGPAGVVKFGSATVPIYRMESGGRVRFAVAYYRDGKRLRQVFQTLDTAKMEAQLVAQRIQSGMQQMTDLKPHDREAYLAVRKMAARPLPSALPTRSPVRTQAARCSGGSCIRKHLRPELVNRLTKCGSHRLATGVSCFTPTPDRFRSCRRDSRGIRRT
jgi:hypothetical protein